MDKSEYLNHLTMIGSRKEGMSINKSKVGSERGDSSIVVTVKNYHIDSGLSSKIHDK
jgi:hypothetical protein